VVVHAAVSPALKTLTVRESITIEAVGRRQSVQADDEPIGHTPVTVQLAPSAVRHLPKPQGLGLRLTRLPVTHDTTIQIRGSSGHDWPDDARWLRYDGPPETNGSSQDCKPGGSLLTLSKLVC
jgi:hypothetical protein